MLKDSIQRLGARREQNGSRQRLRDSAIVFLLGLMEFVASFGVVTAKQVLLA